MANIFFDDMVQFAVEEVKGSPEESYSGGVARVRRTFLVDWSERWSFMQHMVGFTVLPAGGATTAYPQRVRPHPYQATQIENLEGKLRKQKDWLFCTDVERVEGMAPIAYNAALTEHAYEKAKITFIYSSLMYGVMSDHEMLAEGAGEDSLLRYVTKATRPSAEFLTLPFGSYRYVTAPKTPIVGSNGKLVVSAEVHFTWHGIPFNVQPIGWTSYLGSVNETAFVDESVNRTYQAGTLLFTSSERRPYRQLTGALCFDYDYKFRHFEARNSDNTFVGGHNYLLRFKTIGTPDEPVYDLATHTGNVGGKTIYRSAEHHNLFKLQLPSAET